jgi:ZIP family zinc transporter
MAPETVAQDATPLDEQATLQRQLVALGPARRRLARWHTVHILIGVVLVVPSFVHIGPEAAGECGSPTAHRAEKGHPVSTVLSVLGYALIPALATMLGGVIAIFRTPGPGVQGAIQHFAAGVVFAAVAGEVLPEIRAEGAVLPLVLGFSLGVVAMLSMKWFTARMGGHGGGHAGEATGAQPTALLVTVGVDLLMDGLLVGLGFAAGATTGLLLTLALTLEVLFLGLSTAVTLRTAGAPPGRLLATVAALALMIVVGALLGSTLLAGLSGPWLEGVLAFGAAALLYLVTEELLVEAHQLPDTPLMTACFFLGFLAIFLLELVVAAPAA